MPYDATTNKISDFAVWVLYRARTRLEVENAAQVLGLEIRWTDKGFTLCFEDVSCHFSLKGPTC